MWARRFLHVFSISFWARVILPAIPEAHYQQIHGCMQRFADISAFTAKMYQKLLVIKSGNWICTMQISAPWLPSGFLNQQQSPNDGFLQQDFGEKTTRGGFQNLPKLVASGKLTWRTMGSIVMFESCEFSPLLHGGPGTRPPPPRRPGPCAPGRREWGAIWTCGVRFIRKEPSKTIHMFMLTHQNIWKIWNMDIFMLTTHQYVWKKLNILKTGEFFLGCFFYG